jgi:hypothetical protein
MKKIIKHYPMNDRLFVRRGYKYTRITCSKISNIPYDLIFTTILTIPRFYLWLFHRTIWICRWWLNILVTSQYQPRLSSITIFLQYLHQIKLYLNKMKNKEYHSVGLNREKKMIPLTDTWPLNFLAWYKQRKKIDTPNRYMTT